MPSDDRDGVTDNLGWSDLLGMGAIVAGALAVGLGLGLLVDHLLGTLPIFVFVGLVLALGGSVWYLVLKFRTYLNN